jgi:hypothetical protein
VTIAGRRRRTADALPAGNSAFFAPRDGYLPAARPVCCRQARPQHSTVDAEPVEEMTMMTRRRNPRWGDMTTGQQARMVAQGSIQLALLAAALVDIRRRPAEAIKGSKWLWTGVAFINFLGLGPIAYFAFGRKRGAGTAA